MSSTKLGLGTDATIADSGRDSAPTVGSGSAPAGQPARGDTIGRFVVLGVLGSGGMGNVYSAYDPHLDRKVAIKLLHAEIARTNAADARTRLLREAQAMAKINHPNVIKVHEVGTYADQVYVAMEFADAGTLRAWLKTGKREQRDIIELFVQAGRGLAAAHSEGLVHRDFKPDNVLLAKDGSVRVTDFGLVSVMAEQQFARASTAPSETENVAPPEIDIGTSQPQVTPLSQDLTRTGAVMGTPTYMAPEQFTGGETTTQTDQFSFCIALYEALYGERPFRGATYEELCSAVVFGEPHAAPRGSTVPAWMRRALLRGLSRKPAERYPSMVELLAAIAQDPGRRRRNALVLASPLAAIGVGIALFALQPKRGAECSAGSEKLDAVWNSKRRSELELAFQASKRPLASAWFITASKQLDEWTHAWEAAYADACTATRVRGEQSEHLLDLRMQCLARRLDDARATIDQITAGGPEAIDHSLQALHALPSLAPCADTAALLSAVAPPDNQLVVAQVAAVRAQIGNARALEKLGRYKSAGDVARAAQSAANATGYAPVVAEAGVVLGQVQYDLGDKASVDTLRAALHAAAEAGDENTQLDAAAWLVFTLTVQKGEYAPAQEIAGLAEAVAHHAKPPVEKVVRLNSAIGQLDARRGKPAEAQARYEKALALAVPLGEDHEATLSTLNQLATTLMERGKLEDARKAYERVLAARERLYGKDHPDVAAALNNVGNVYRRESKYDDAKRAYERALAIREAALGPDHPEVGTTLNNLGTFFSEIGDRAKAKEVTERALAIWEKAYGPTSPEIVPAVSNLGEIAMNAGDYDAARKHMERALSLVEQSQGKDGTGSIDLLTNLGVLEQEQQHFDKALEVFKRAQAIAEKAYGPDHTDVADILANEATIYKHQNKLAEAAELNTHVLRIYENKFGPDHPRVGMILSNLGELNDVRGDHKAAMDNFQKSLAVFEGKLGKDHPYVSYPLLGIGGELMTMNKPAEALPYFERALAIRTASNMQPDQIAEARDKVAEAKKRLGAH
jgi:serine/threonine protein kinase/Tfp pilus assembly protein PilF